jgi:hypothetical protein
MLPEEFEQLPIIHFYCAEVKASLSPSGLDKTGFTGFQINNTSFTV